MGTSGSYKGGGGKPGRDLRNGIGDRLDSLQDTLLSPTPQQPSDGPPVEQRPDLPKIPPEALLNIIPMFRPRSGGTSDGPGGAAGGGGRGAISGSTRGSSGGGARRSVVKSASTAGRAAAASYAFRTGNRDILRNLGLDYDDLTGKDPIFITQKIVEAACGPFTNSTIEDEERRLVAAEVAQWVLEENEEGAPPDPEEIVRETIALIIFEAIATETAAFIRENGRQAGVNHESERQIRETAKAYAQRINLPATGLTAEEFASAIEQGIEMLRNIWEGQ